MKILRIGSALLLLLVVGMLLMTHLTMRQEARDRLRNFENQGASLVSLLALYPLEDYRSDRRDVLMRIVGENVSGEGFLYLFVHDEEGKPFLAMAAADVAAGIPPAVQAESLYNPLTSRQRFTLHGREAYEFAKPIFAGGRKVGTVRLGLRPPTVPVLSGERVSLLALMVFLVLAALIFGYYGVMGALTPLKKLSRSLPAEPDPADPPRAERGEELLPVLSELEESLRRVREHVLQIGTDNVALTSRLGVTTFERNQIARILDTIPFGIVVTDIHNNVGTVNDFLCRLLGRKPEELIDRPLSAVLPNPDILAYVSRYEDNLPAVHPKPLETTLPAAAPGERFLVSLAALSDGKGEPMGKMLSVRNVTAARLAEDAQHQFIAHVAHELLTPLTNIKSYSEMLMDGEVADREMQREFYNTINEETDRLANLVKTLLNISKMEMGSLTINKGLVRTDWFVEGCLSAIEAAARDKGLTIEKRLPDAYPSLMADKELLKAAIINTLGNALKYTPPGGTITFAITDEGPAVAFETIDTGYGIAEEDLPRIFEKFYRSGQAEVAAQTGSGLGLAITSEIVHLHGGKIDVNSRLGEGTRMTIRIPKEEHYLGVQ